VHPKYRGLRLGRRLYDARKELCRSLNFTAGFIAGGRIPGYSKYADNFTPVRYIEEVKNRKFFLILCCHFNCLMVFMFVNMTGYLPADEDSLGYATYWNG